MRTQNKAFTLVELIIVITILAILATIGFMSFQSYTMDARDTNRITSLKVLSDGLNIYQAKNTSLAMPNDYVTITANGTPISYQGYVGNSVLSSIKASDTKDPLDESYYTYLINANKNKFQLMGFLENDTNLTAYNILEKTYARDYTTRYPINIGDKLGILLSTGSNTPIQELKSASFTGVDIVNTSIAYNPISKNGFSSIVGSQNIATVKSCKEILDSLGALYGKDGVYYINPTGTGSFQVYCDMTTDGWGWTLVGISKTNSGTDMLTNNQLGDYTNINSNTTVKMSTDNINKILFGGLRNLKIENNVDNKKWIIEYANNGQALDFINYKSYNISITEPYSGKKSPFFDSHPHFILFSGITNDLTFPTSGCNYTNSYERISYGTYMNNYNRYCSICLDGTDKWEPFIKWTNYSSINIAYYKMFVK